MIKKLAFISDIHSNVTALKAVLDDITKRKIELSNVYCLGDLIGYGPRPNDTIELIKEYGITSILGNYDESVGFYLPTCGCSVDSNSDAKKTLNSFGWTVEHTSEENKRFLRELPEDLTFDFHEYGITLTHGSPFSIVDYVYEDDIEKQRDIAEDIESDIIVFGHTHIPYTKNIHEKLFINVGSVGRPKDGDNRACYCIVTFSHNITVDFIRVSYDIESVAKEIEESDLLDDFADNLRTGKIKS